MAQYNLEGSYKQKREAEESEPKSSNMGQLCLNAGFEDGAAGVMNEGTQAAFKSWKRPPERVQPCQPEDLFRIPNRQNYKMINE